MGHSSFIPARTGREAEQVYRLSCMSSRTQWRRVALITMAWAAVVAWALAIFALSSQPGDPAGGGARLRLSWEKVAHFVVFALLAVGTANALTVSGTRSRRFWWTFVLCALYAVTDELHQVTVPNRNPNVFDVLIDMAGASAGYFAYRWLSLIEMPRRRLAAALASHRRGRRTDPGARAGGRVR